MIKFDIRDLSFSYGEIPVLKNLNININDNTINVILAKNNELYNRVGKGDKYYVPRGVNYIDTVEFNDK